MTEIINDNFNTYHVNIVCELGQPLKACHRTKSISHRI